MGVLDGKVALVTGASRGIGAGTALPGTIDQFAVQVEAPFHLATLVLPGMRARGAGWILNISSVAARHPAIPPDAGAGRGGTVYGMCQAALERFSTGLAAELYPDNIAVNALAPTRVVPTPGTLFHHLTTEGDPRSEPPAVMAEAALLPCHREPRTLTGRIAYSKELLGEFGVLVPRLRADAIFRWIGHHVICVRIRSRVGLQLV
jgi:citronellol/citronellal dehydrogenase